jgi:hypothetical protein
MGRQSEVSLFVRFLKNPNPFAVKSRQTQLAVIAEEHAGLVLVVGHGEEAETGGDAGRRDPQPMRVWSLARMCGGAQLNIP